MSCARQELPPPPCLLAAASPAGNWRLSTRRTWELRSATSPTPSGEANGACGGEFTHDWAPGLMRCSRSSPRPWKLRTSSVP
eukprot:3549939-Alexandrium_andersonii.AAC.1